MPQGGEIADVSPISPFLIGFKPRQVILAERQHINSKLPTSMAKNQDMESVLACSVALWLENKGFSKVLKRFLSVAQIQDDWRAKAIDLNDVLSKHLATSKDGLTDASSQKKHDSQVVESVQINGGTNGCVDEENETEKKKKKNKGGDVLATEENLKDQNSKKVNELPVDQSHNSKKDKKKKGTNVVAESIDNTAVIDKAVECKDKKKKKKLKDNNLEDDKDLGNKKKDNVAAGESKVSKKRKRVVADEAENESDKEIVVEESKPKKNKGEKEDVQVQNKVSAGVGDTQEEKPANDDGEENFSFSQPKSGRKQNGNSSAEPKSVNAFQRVKIDEVEFADERLQDNSYWAKHGAETGYGAKAQEVLGQVRGRDFRHEKTKKKRGSYRGGIIDLQSHSIKFDNSDDE